MYKYKDALRESTEYFNNELAARAFLDKYALRNNNNELLEKTPDQMHRRLSKEFARIESKYPNPLSEEEIFSLLDKFEYIIPQGSPMSAIGNDYKIQCVGNCYTLRPPLDSIGSIMYTDQELAQLYKRRAGCGVDLSNIRPKGLSVQNAANTTDGIGSFMEQYSNTCRSIAQGGRRGALLLSLSVHHPEIETFIKIKQNREKVTGANISIKFSKEFMDALKKDAEYEQRWPIENPTYTKKVKAKKIWDMFVESAHGFAEPGAFFWQNVETGIANCYGDKYSAFKDQTSNPCGEIIMGTDSCRLLAINLFGYVKFAFTKKAVFDFELFAEHAQKAQRLMDDLIDIELEQIDKILAKIDNDPEPDHIKAIERNMWVYYRNVCEQGRRTGLGITALGDVIAALGMTYSDDNSIKFAEKIYKTLCVNAYKSTCILAKERGAFPIFDPELEKNNSYLKRILANDNLKELYKSGRRNIALLTTAPTGTISLLAKIGPYHGTTSGIEPAYEIVYKRRKKGNPGDNDFRVDFVDQSGDHWMEFEVDHPGFALWKSVSGKDKIEESPYHKATANDVDWVRSVDIQAAAQKWICHSISKTCNVPEHTSVEIIDQIYRTACEKGCKGFTIYRDGCRTGVLIKNTLQKTNAPKRPKTLPCDVHHINVRGHKYMVFVGLYQDEPYEIMAYEGEYEGAKSGTITKVKRGVYKGELGDFTVESITDNCTPEEEAITRLVSTSLRHGTPLEYIVHQLEKTAGELNTFAKCLARTVKRYIKDGTQISGEGCPKCQGKLVRHDGCKTCTLCQWTACN